MNHTPGFPYAAGRESDTPLLLVDDEVAILDGLRRQLRRRFVVTTATSGAEALSVMESQQFAVVVSDMRMPEMDGAEFLAHARKLYPDTVRMLLTGQADMTSAIAAINQGQIFRFLTKPCQPEVLQSALGDAVEQNRLVRAEKELLEKTLRSTVQTLTATLSLAHPKAFSRALRITRTVSEVAEELDVETPWEVEVTAMLAHLGAVSLPPGVLDKIDAGLPLNEDERMMAERVSATSAQLVAQVPRLEGVAAAIELQHARYDGTSSTPGAPVGDDLPLAARILKVAMDFDAAMSRRPAAQNAIAALRGDAGAHDPSVLDALTRCHAVDAAASPPQKVEFDALEPGMVLMEDVLSDRGILLVGRGTAVTEPLLQRLDNFRRQDGISAPILVESR